MRTIEDFENRISFFSSKTSKNGVNLFLFDDNDYLDQVDSLSGVSIYSKSVNVFVHKDNKINNCTILSKNNNTIIVERSNYAINSLCIHMKSCDGGTVYIGKNFSCWKNILRLRESKRIIIGDDNMWSSNISLWVSDGHAITDNTGKCINKGKDIILMNHIWLSDGVKILKGVTLANGIVVGANSLVTKPCTFENCILAGSPAKVIKKDISWHRKNPEFFI